MDARTKLVEATIECLQDLGYARTTTRAIVGRAGSHVPAVNYYFGSKERLLEEAIVEALRRWAESTMSSAGTPTSAPPRQQLRRGFQRFHAALPSDRPYVVAAIEAFAQAERSETLRARLGDAYEDFRASVASTLSAAVGGDTDDPPRDARDVASVMIALFDGLAIQWLLDPDRAPSAKAVARSLDLLSEVLAQPATEQRTVTSTRARSSGAAKRGR